MKGNALPIVGSSDSHNHDFEKCSSFARHFTLVFAKENTTEAILDAIRSGYSLAAEIPQKGSDGITVTNGETEGVHDGIFYYQRLEEADKYTVFLDGNQPLVRIRNEANVGKGKLLVVRDSYGNCVGPMLAESFEEVILVDLRYYRMPVSAICESEGITNVLVMYSLSNFMTDANFPFLR